MRVTALGLACAEPQSTWKSLLQLPPTDLLVLPELCFAPWLCADRDVDPQAWSRAAEQQQLHRLDELNAKVVVGTMAVVENDERYNNAFVFEPETGLRLVHRKTFLPDEPGFWEATWYRRGPVQFDTVQTRIGRIGISICTEMWFTQHLFDDVDLVLVPRATPAETTTKWLAGGAAHAVCSGAFCVSSNRAEHLPATTMGGHGWIIGPDGDSHADPADEVLVADIDLAEARAAKDTYPRYVETAPE